jgi:hypothetical protein
LPFYHLPLHADDTVVHAGLPSPFASGIDKQQQNLHQTFHTLLQSFIRSCYTLKVKIENNLMAGYDFNSSL